MIVGEHTSLQHTHLVFLPGCNSLAERLALLLNSPLLLCPPCCGGRHLGVIRSLRHRSPHNECRRL